MNDSEDRLMSGESLVERLRHARNPKQAFKEFGFWVLQRMAVHNVEGLKPRKPGVFKPSQHEQARRHNKKPDV